MEPFTFIAAGLAIVCALALFFIPLEKKKPDHKPIHDKESDLVHIGSRKLKKV